MHGRLRQEPTPQAAACHWQWGQAAPWLACQGLRPGAPRALPAVPHRGSSEGLLSPARVLRKVRFAGALVVRVQPRTVARLLAVPSDGVYMPCRA